MFNPILENPGCPFLFNLAISPCSETDPVLICIKRRFHDHREVVGEIEILKDSFHFPDISRPSGSNDSK